MTSIRIFLTVALVATITLGNFVSALHGYRESMQEAQRLFDTLLTQHAELIKSYAFYDESTMAETQSEAKVINGVFDREKETTFAFQIWRAHELLVRSANAPAELIVPLKDQTSETNFNGYRWTTLASFDSSNGTWILVAERDDLRYQLAETMVLESVLPIVLVIPFLGLAIWWIVGFGLKPISELADQLEKKEAADLSPVRIARIPKELTLLAMSANALLRRLEASFAREKRFASDAAHELRTPIAALKIHLQNLVIDLESPPESAQKLKWGVDRMGHLVEQILSLNRTASGRLMAQFVCLDLSGVAKKVIGDHIGAINSKKQSITFSGPGVELYGDLFTIEVLIQNLLSNAVKYTPEGGKIMVKTETRPEGVVLQVIDNGPGIPEDQYERVFERFYRVGGDRHDLSLMGCGLGLSIVKQIVDLHGASITLEKSRDTSGLCVTVVFPLSPECAKNRTRL